VRYTLSVLLTAACLLAGPAAAEVPTEPAAAAHAFDQGMQAVVAPYMTIHDALARDSIDGVAEAAAALAAAAGTLDPAKAPAPHARHYAKVPSRLIAGAEAVRDAKDLAAARAAFKGLSQPMGLWATMSEPPGLDLVYCSMSQGGWLQRSGPIRNPYHGASMLSCGEVVRGPGKTK